MTVRVTTLPNGMKVMTDSMDTVETVSLGVWTGVGSRNEVEAVNGISHVLEHMAFKGTARRNAQDIAEEIEDVGGHLNAYTSREATAYYAKVLKDDVPVALDLVSDILQNAAMDPEELAREQSVIVQEINQVEDTPDDIIFDHFQEAAYPDQALGRPVLGQADVVRGLDRETIFGFLRRHYHAPAMVLAAAGRIDHEALVADATTAFADLPDGQPAEAEAGAYAGGETRRDRALEQLHLILGFESVRYDDPDFYAASVFSTLLGGGMSSRLFQELREKRGLAYTVQAFSSAYTDTGLFGVYAGTGEKETPELVSVLADEMQKVADDVTEAEVRRARAQLKASILMSLESTSARCEQLARQVQVYGRPLPPEELVEKLEAVDATAVARVARRTFQSRPTLSAVGPTGGLESYDSLAARFG